MVLSDSPTTPSAPCAKTVTPPPLRIIDSAELLETNGRVWIQHRGQLYELRETRLGKLILTK